MKKILLLTLNLSLFVSFLFSQNSEYWAVLSGDFFNGSDGEAFSVDENGQNFESEHLFFESNGNPNWQTGLCEANNGKLFGVSEDGGENNLGYIFEFDPNTSILKSVFSFNDTIQGRQPYGNIMLANNGFIYGTTTFGGINDDGVVFEFDPNTYSYNKKFDFDNLVYGKNPLSSLMQANNGLLYGVTESGGINNNGVLFEYDIVADIFTKNIDFNIIANGYWAQTQLYQAYNGKLYGTMDSGFLGEGLLYEYDITTNTITLKVNFPSNNISSAFYSNVIEADTNLLFGSSIQGGLFGSGYIYKYDLGLDLFTMVHSFDYAAGQGRQPTKQILKKDNEIIGLTSNGGDFDDGTIFKFGLDTEIFTQLYSFNKSQNTEIPVGGLTLASSGKLYGVGIPVEIGQFNGFSKQTTGDLFEFDLNNLTLTNIVKFHNDGYLPINELVVSPQNICYGVAFSGGVSNAGLIYSLNPRTKEYNVLHLFDASSNTGHSPISIYYHQSNKLYGLNISGGDYNDGSIFEYDLNTSNLTKMQDLNSLALGLDFSSFVKGDDNDLLYFMTSSGGDNIGIQGNGSIYELNLTSNILTKKQNFTSSNGGRARGKLVFAKNKKFYGLAESGGDNNGGTLFEYDPITNVIIKKVDFNNLNGRNPFGSLIEAKNGNLYGQASFGGTNNSGVLFEYDIVLDTLTVLHNFEAINGESPTGNLIETSEGLLIGTTLRGGIYGVGVIFSFDLATNQFIKTKDLKHISTNNANVMSPSFVEVKKCSNSTANTSILAQNTYTSPSGNYTWTETGVYQDTLFNANACGGDSILSINLTIENNTSIQNTEFEQIFYYPNPTNGELIIELGETQEELKAKVYSYDGKEIADYHFKNTDKLNMKLIGSKGIYFIKIQSKSKQSIIRVLKN